MIILNDLDPIFIDYFIKVWLRHHLFYFVKTIMQLSVINRNMMTVDNRIQVNPDFLLVLDFIGMYIRHFHLFNIDGFVIGPVIFLEMFNGHKLLSSSCYSWLSYNTHGIVQVNISIIK
jgi:uncharacterized membrane protein YGL010W